MPAEKFIVAVRQWNLGYLKGETVRRGNVIIVDREHNSMTIDGREYKEIRDIDIAKRQAAANPDNPLVVPFSEKVLAVLRQPIVPIVSSTKKPRQLMEVVQSDEDTHEVIDISDTQISKKTAAAKEADRLGRKRGGKMEIVKGDETPAEVQARVRAALARNPEQVRAEIYGSKMPVVRDDSLGVDTSAPARNAGQKLPNLKTAKQKESQAKAEAQLRKKSSDSVRPSMPVEFDDNELPPTQEEAEAALVGEQPVQHPGGDSDQLRKEMDGMLKGVEAKFDAKFEAIMGALNRLAPVPAPAAPAPAPVKDNVVRTPVRAKAVGKKGGRK